MQITKYLFLICAFSVAIITFATTTLRNKVGSAQQTKGNTSNAEDGKREFSIFQDKRIVAFGHWGTMTYMIRLFDKTSDYERGGQYLSIFNESGDIIYEEKAVSFGQVYSESILRNSNATQLVININYGGSSLFLKILDYQNGKVVDLMRDVDSSFSANAEITPQFRTGGQPYREPYQIILTESNLATNKHQASIYRYVNGKYTYIGVVSQEKVGDAIESLIRKK